MVAADAAVTEAIVTRLLAVPEQSKSFTVVVVPEVNFTLAFGSRVMLWKPFDPVKVTIPFDAAPESRKS